MSKRRITLNLDADVVEALQAVGGHSMSAVANEADYADADAFLATLEHGDGGTSAA